jgi:uncharacterized protein
MRAVVLADTHIPDFARVLPSGLISSLRRADLILHAGDVTSAAVLDQLADYAPVHVAMGNRDRQEVAAWGAQSEVQLQLDGVPVAMVHDSGPRVGRERRLTRRFPHSRLIVFGHSHIPVDTRTGEVRFFNPGSPTWKRMQPLPTYGLITVTSGRVRTRIVELLG